MKKITISLFLCIVLIVIAGCAKKAKQEIIKTDDLLYINYISEYTTGSVSCTSSITIRLAANADLDNREIALENGEVVPGILTIKPSVKGKAVWDEPRVIRFYPDDKLPSGSMYNCELALSKIFDVPEELSLFPFSFSVLKQDFDVTIGDVLFSGDTVTKQTITGIITTADWASIDNVKRIITVKGKDKELPVLWEHDLAENKHTFKIENINREKNTYAVKIDWNGDPIGVNKKGSTSVDIYGLEVFKYLNYRLVLEEERHMDMQFSMPLDEKQKLAGIIAVNGDNSPSFFIEKNIISLYPSKGAKNTLYITINNELKDMTGSKLGEKIELSVTLKQELPQIRWVRKKGGILPGTEGFIIPFEAISLKAVDVSVIEVYEDNLIQFLQVNRDITGNREIKRVGRPVLYKTISLEHKEVKDLYEWNRFNLDFSDLIKPRPGSLYQVRINFRRSQSVYYCSDSEEEIIADEMLKENWDSQQERSNWDYWDDYYYDDYYWENRNNPCKDAYYGKQREIATNILSSDLGIIAKGTENGELHVFLTDIKNTDTMSGIDIDVYNFQQQVIASGKTNASGYAFIQVKDTDSIPFAIIARRGKERGYLRVDDGTSLSVSNFDVGGSSAKRGIKGFIYGERGVWRPGDTMYLTFILEDKEHKLPANHPVIFELVNPKSRVEERIVKTEHLAGIYSFPVKTDPDDPTGDWKARVRVGGEVFSKDIKVETVKPNRLKINLDFGTDRLSALDESITGTIEATWLHGAPAKHLRAEFTLLLNPMLTSFDGYPGFSFDDPSREYYPERETVFDDNLSEEGKASFSFSPGTIDNAPGALKAIFLGKVYEEGGDFSIDKLTLPYYPYTSFAGIKLPPGDKTRGMLLTDEDHKVQIASVDPRGNPLSRKGLEVSVYKLSWKWWWDQSGEDLSSYVGRSYSQRIANGTVDTKNGKGEWNLRINYPDWGRYFIRVYDPGSKHAAGKIFYIDWPGWAGSAQKGELGGATMLSFYSDKNEYTVGEKAEVTIPVSADGRALVSLETGNRVVQNFWVQTKKGKTTFQFDVTSRMSPTVYIHVTLVQPHAQVSNDLPVRLYGVFPVKVIDPGTKLQPEISIADTLAPEKEVSIVIKEKSSKPMAYTLAVVDEGLLDITNFDTPGPWSSFYAKEALGVKTWDIYDEVIGILSGHFGPLLAIGGGGDELVPPKDQKAERFKPVVKFFGPFYLAPGKTNNHNFIMPRYIGSVKTMVVAAYEGAYGNADATSFVKESVMVLGTLPRVLGPGEKIKLPVNVFALEEGIKSVDISIKTEGPLQLAGKASQKIAFNKPGEKFVYFDLFTPEEIGIAKVFITAQWGQEKTGYDVELDVRPSNPVETKVYQAIIESGKEWKMEVTPTGLAGTNKMTLELSYLPPVNLEKRLSFLIQFPHGCIEQTISSVFPQVYLDEIVDLSPAQTAEIEKNIKAGIDKLKSFRTSSGGFGYWPGDAEASKWGSNYAGHFLLEAKNKGYNVPEGMLGDWANYQESVANRWDNKKSFDEDINQAYRLYTLALYGRPNLGAMNRLKEKQNLDNRVRWRLAAAYVLAGKKSIAEQVINAYKLDTSVQDYQVTSATYGSALRDKAMILETLVLMENRDMGFSLLKEIAESLGSENWHSTQTTAYALVAIAKFGASQGKGDQIACDYTFGNEKGTLQGNKPFVSAELPVLSAPLTIKNTKTTPVYARFISRGIPLQGKELDEEKVISMTVTYKLKDNSIIKDLSKFTQGTDIFIETEIKNSGIYGNLEELALTQIVPSGWEILNLRLQDIEDYSGFSKPEYQDIRDDRVYTYFDMAAGETKVFRIMVNAAYLGEYYMPGVNCEAMYNNEITSKKKGRRIVIFE
ncbi:MAG: hypothetical protein JXB88_19825 [Spirochaetales bacterium]|nr:hypothetical protein [Spirochaetales bacterium]